MAEQSSMSKRTAGWILAALAVGCFLGSATMRTSAEVWPGGPPLEAAPYFLGLISSAVAIWLLLGFRREAIGALVITVGTANLVFCFASILRGDPISSSVLGAGAGALAVGATLIGRWHASPPRSQQGQTPGVPDHVSDGADGIGRTG